ncbi:hypothetical protein MNBD_PLANCTO03-1574 [hydrothermal vent metagenome]|uniref:PPM-type phosphatase domain-containing protein n=1 Tax=hydrothermal vent metagenome TaxID=652676 RepID=A0A3B1E7G8_9ZZZZ
MAKNTRTTAAYTTEFHHEFRVETGRLLRRRFLWFTAVVWSLGLLSLLGGAVIAFGGLEGQTVEAIKSPLMWVFSVVWLGMYVWAFLFAWKQRPQDEVLLRLSFWVVTIDGLLALSMKAVGVPGTLGIGGFFITHLFACLFLPWTPWQALRPMLVVLSVNVPVTLVLAKLGQEPSAAGGPPAEWLPNTLIMLALMPFLALPGMLWCWVRHSKRTQDFKYRFMSSRYTEMRRELVDARKIHESLFPRPITEGELRFSFEYEPMRQIGGDFLYASRKKEAGGVTSFSPPLSIVLLDVTGHGIPAALTVNRLHGELERVFAENPDIGPGEVLRLLNRYVHLTLSTHSIYLTAFCFRVDTEASTLEYASGGHPPAFLRAVDGTIEELPSTAFVLGACPDEAFDAAPRTLAFGPGDTAFAYTDGAIEARDETGTMIRIDGLRRMVASVDGMLPTTWPAAFRDEVVGFRGGPPEDDTLMLVVHRMVGDPLNAKASSRQTAADAR